MVGRETESVTVNHAVTAGRRRTSMTKPGWAGASMSAAVPDDLLTLFEFAIVNSANTETAQEH